MILLITENVNGIVDFAGAIVVRCGISARYVSGVETTLFLTHGCEV